MGSLIRGQFFVQGGGRYLSLRCYKHQFNDRWICALGVKGRGVRLWDLESKSMVRNFCGVQQKNNVYDISSGGRESEFFAAASEDKRISIWHINMELPLKTL